MFQLYLRDGGQLLLCCHTMTIVGGAISHRDAALRPRGWDVALNYFRVVNSEAVLRLHAL
jgi:hypothetical protein